MRIGVIGCGVMGQHHLNVYQSMPGVQIVGICDINEDLVKYLSKRYKSKPYTQYKDLLEKELDAVDIVVPTTIHHDIAIDALDAGFHVLVEKPIADTVELGEDIVKKAREKNRKLMVGHVERFNPAVTRLKEIITEGLLGEIASISARRVGPYTPRTYDVGVILDLGTHDIDIISYLYEQRVKDVYAIAGAQIHSFEDHASLMLRFNNGNAGVVETNWLTPHRVRKLSAVGLDGVASLDFIEQVVTIYDKEWAREAKVDKKEPLYNEIEHFVNVIKTSNNPLVSGEDSIHALAVALAAIESYKTGRVVPVNGNF